MVGWDPGGRAGNPGGRGGGGGRVGALFIIQCTQFSPLHTLIPRRAGTFQIPVHAMFPGAHLETPQGWDNNNNIGGLPVNHLSQYCAFIRYFIEYFIEYFSLNSLHPVLSYICPGCHPYSHQKTHSFQYLRVLTSGAPNNGGLSPCGSQFGPSSPRDEVRVHFLYRHNS